MQTKLKLISAAVLIACGGLSTQSHAALPSNAILTFTAGVSETSAYGTVTVKVGSYFGMDTNGDGLVRAFERTAISQNAGLSIGKAQDASGSHGGDADGTEAPGIDNAWGFFGNTGMTYSINPVNILSDDLAGGVTLDFSGFGVTWNGITRIDMSQGAWEANTDGAANLTCAVDCANGDTYTLQYSARVPAGDPSGFGGVGYNFYIEGTITIPPATDVSEGTFDGGSISGAGSDARVSMSDIVAAGNAEDTGFTFNGSLYDFAVTGVTTGANISVQISLTAPIPANAVYRKLINSSWVTFTDDANNWIASAAKVSGTCPIVSDPVYVKGNGLTEGDECIQITIQESGIYDADVSTTDIADPGGVATAVVESVDTRVSGTDGCSMSGNPVASNQRADWWLVAGFMGLLGLFRLKRKA